MYIDLDPEGLYPEDRNSIHVLASLYEDHVEKDGADELIVGAQNKTTGKRIRIVISYDKD